MSKPTFAMTLRLDWALFQAMEAKIGKDASKNAYINELIRKDVQPTKKGAK